MDPCSVCAYDSHLKRIQELTDQVGTLKAEVEHLKDVLHIDQTGLVAALDKVRQLCTGYSWAPEGRGPYAWDDDEYRQEFGRALRDIQSVVDDAIRKSGDLVHTADGCRRNPLIAVQTELRDGR